MTLKGLRIGYYPERVCVESFIQAGLKTKPPLYLFTAGNLQFLEIVTSDANCPQLRKWLLVQCYVKWVREDSAIARRYEAAIANSMLED